VNATNHHAEEVSAYAEYATKHANPLYRTVLAPNYAYTKWFIGEHLGGQQSMPHLSANQTTSKKLSMLQKFTGHGAKWEIVINKGLLLVIPEEGLPNAAWVRNSWPAPGLRRFTEGLLERQLVCQYVREIENEDEGTYGGFGPEFCTIANRISEARTWLTRVVPRRRGAADDGAFLGRHWPHICELEADPNCYGDDLTPAAIALAVGSSGTRAAPLRTPPSQGIWEYILFLHSVDRDEDVWEMARRQIDWLEKLRERRFPHLHEVESGKVDPDKSPITTEVLFEAMWLSANNGLVGKMAEAISLYRSYHDLPILADALEDVGCEDPHILRHLRAEIQHTVNCWVLRGLQDRAPSQS
jgi:hypothetical protein